MADFGGLGDKAKKFADDHDEQVDRGLETAGDKVAERVGHGDQIDKAVDKAQERTGDGDTTSSER